MRKGVLVMDKEKVSKDKVDIDRQIDASMRWNLI